MRISIELFLLDNLVMNLLGLKLGEALRGEKGRRDLLCSLLGAVWSLLALACWPQMLSIWGRLLCLGVMGLLTAQRGRYPLTLLSLLCAYALLGGGLLLLQVGLGLPIQSDGVLLSTVPVRLALYGALGGLGLIRLLRSLVRRGYAQGQEADIVLRMGERTFACRAFLDTGNLLREPVSGLPVVLEEGFTIEEGAPLFIEGWGEVPVERGEMYFPTEGIGAIEVYIGKAPMKLGKGRAIVPVWALPLGRRENLSKRPKRRRNVQNVRDIWNKSTEAAVAAGHTKAQSIPAPFIPSMGAGAAEPVMVPADGGEPAGASDGGGGEPIRPSCPEGGVGEEQAH